MDFYCSAFSLGRPRATIEFHSEAESTVLNRHLSVCPSENSLSLFSTANSLSYEEGSSEEPGKI